MGNSQMQPKMAVVVGVDRKASSQRAIDEGVKLAQRTGRPVHLVYATGVGIVPWSKEYLAGKDDFMKTCRERAAAMAPDTPVTYAVHVAEPAAMLVHASETASVVVMGSAGLGRATDVLRGSATGKVMAHAHCAVMVVPHSGEWDTDGPIVVGLDIEAHSRPALEWAYAQASVEKAPLVALHTWWWEEPDPFYSSGALGEEWLQVEKSQELELSEMLAGWREKYPDVQVTPTVIRGQAAFTLEELSATARMVVLGTRGRGGFAGLMLGSVSNHTAHHAHCPVVVVPSTKR